MTTTDYRQEGEFNLSDIIAVASNKESPIPLLNRRTIMAEFASDRFPNDTKTELLARLQEIHDKDLRHRIVSLGIMVMRVHTAAEDRRKIEQQIQSFNPNVPQTNQPSLFGINEFQNSTFDA